MPACPQAKSCWAGFTSGRLRLQIQYSALDCKAMSCAISNPPQFNETTLPKIAFYADYDEAFQEVSAQVSLTIRRMEIDQIKDSCVVALG